MPVALRAVQAAMGEWECPHRDDPKKDLLGPTLACLGMKGRQAHGHEVR